VAFGGGAVDEWLWPGETGLRVDERTPAAFARALDELLGDPARCAAMSLAARQRYPHFHPEAYTVRLLESFGRTIRQHRGR
jgi:glycosyltransferase involved in cell wall biosynthesis